MSVEARPVHVLATGFEPFDGRTVNSSWHCLRPLLERPIAGVRLSAIELPVSRRHAADRLLGIIERSGADAVVMFGEAGGRGRVTPERVAINVDDYRIPDNLGAQPRNESVVPGGPVGYFSTLPLETMLTALERAEIPAAISNTAGTYLCNHVFYRVMHALAADGSDIPAGFVHLPHLHEQVKGCSPPAPSLDASTLSTAVTACVRVTAQAVRLRESGAAQHLN